MPAAVSPPAESIAVGLPPVLAPSAAPVPAAAPPPSAAPPPPPALVAEIAIMPVPTELGSLREPTRTWQNAETALVASVTPPHEPRLDPLLPGELTASQNQGSFKHAMTQALLWLMTIDEPQRYTLPQARAITIRAMRSWLIGLFDPIRGQVGRRVQRAREDWEKSGEVVAKQKARQQRRQREVDVDPQAGPLSGR
jgi:hypothetical protein